MTTADLSHKEIESFNDTLIKELPKGIEMLDLYDNQISSFKGCENLPNSIKILGLDENQINSFEHSDQLPRTLKDLYLIGNQISSFDHSEGLPRNLKKLIIDTPKIKCSQKILRYTQFKFDPLETIKFLQHYQDFVPILNEIKYNPRLERMKSKLEEEEKQIKKDPESFYKLII